VELNWSTFLLEVINFLILVWLLKRFLYQPVLNVIAQRRQKIETELAEAAKGQQAAEALQRQYEERLAHWETERRDALDQLAQQIAQQRSQRLRQLDDELEQQRLKHQAREQQQQVQWRSQAETEALQLGGSFTARLLRPLAGPELDARLQPLFIDQLAALPENTLSPLREGWADGSARLEVISSTALDDAQQQIIRQALEQKLGPRNGPWQFRQNPQLIAGLRVSIGGWLLHANLQDELRFFSGAAHGQG